MVKFTALRVSAVRIPVESSLRRDRIRPEVLQDPSYGEKYDSTTFFYDVVSVADGLVLVGPPLLNLEELVTNAKIEIDGVVAKDAKIVTRRLERSQETRVLFRSSADESRAVVMILPGGERLDLRPEAEMHGLFEGRKVLMTLQKDEELAWIADWVKFHHEVHGVDAVLIYDNASERYSADEVLGALRTVGGIEVAVVVSWPFKYGPQGCRAPGGVDFGTLTSVR